jgi:RsiW-degrading membrane proteinase PrsW (M82 family)
VASILISLFGFEYSNLHWLGASSAGIVEEIGKLLAVVVFCRQGNYKYILNGLLFGAAVGAGFSAFESAGYAFDRLWSSANVDAMLGTMYTRAFLAPFGHVPRTAIAAGALWRAKGDRPFSFSMFVDARFLKAFSIPVVLHMIWNAPIPSPFNVVQLSMGVIGWIVVLGLVQQGLQQVRDEQRKAAKTMLATRSGL